MKFFVASSVALSLACLASASTEERPRAGKVEIMKSAELKPGMKATAWTVFQGTEAEAVPVEIIGLWKNAWGPKQDIILAKMGGKALRTGVAGGMSGSPVYIDGKLIGAIALRISVFSPDAICSITPIELMLEINDFDASRPAYSKAPGNALARSAVPLPGEFLGQAVGAQQPMMVPIETPLTFSGFHSNVLREFAPMFQQMGINPVQGGASGALTNATPAANWKEALRPGDSIAGVLVSGDMNVTVLGTTTYNDGKRVLGFGHPMFNLGPVNMPMAKGEVLMVLSSQFQPNKIANATEVVGALKQDRHSGIMGELGTASEMIPVTVKVRSYGESGAIRKEKDLNHVFVQQKWTPYLMMVTLFNSVSGMNDFAEETTFRLSGEVELEGQPSLSLSTMLAPGDVPVPASMMLAGWWGDKFNRLFANAVKTPQLKRVNAVIDLLPERRVATIESAFLGSNEVQAGTSVPVKVYLRPYRGDRIEREVQVKIPAGLPKGEHRILLSDADSLNRTQSFAGSANRFIDLPEAVSLINQERSNNRLYVSLVQARPTYYEDDKVLPSLPASVLNVMQTGRSATRPFISSAESTQEQMSIPFDYMVSGSQSLRITVR
ncbi:MAG: SpoIVB peptidase S55 domain-containing protein [Bryobacteraceae bacterium]